MSRNCFKKIIRGEKNLGQAGIRTCDRQFVFTHRISGAWRSRPRGRERVGVRMRAPAGGWCLLNHKVGGVTRRNVRDMGRGQVSL